MGNNVAVPYSGFIPGGLQVGTDVVISGRAPMHSDSFSINLCEGPNYNQGCALHFNPRFSNGHVVRNHMQGGQWGNEETGGGFPFKKGHGFELHMKVTPHGYKVTLNHRHFCDFHHRVPKESVKYIYIEGEVVIHYIQFREQNRGPVPVAPGAGGFPNYPTGPVCPPGPAYPPSMPVPGYPAGGAAGPIYSPPVPFTSPIPGGLYPGKIMYISGTPRPNASRFTVNIMCGPSDNYDISLHFDVRMNYGNDYNQVIRTHKDMNNWGSEERQITYFPFMPNTPFEIMILAEPASFKVAVNNQHFVEFFHRIQPITRATHINVNGDVTLSQVRFQ